MSTPPSGRQYVLTAGAQRAVVVEIEGGVRSYEVDGQEVLQPYPQDAICDGAHGSPLIPWPNRLADGRYSFDGTDYQVPLTEPGKHNAIHGLLRWHQWSVREKTESRIVLAARLSPQPGYPFVLDVEIEYELGDDGLVARTTATNSGDSVCPYGCGQHPYLSPGAGRIDECTLELKAGTRITTDEERQLPTGREAVAGTPYDFSTARRLGDLAIDYAFTDFDRDEQGRAWVRLRRPDGRTAELWVDDGYPIVEIYTGDTLAPDRQRRGLGTEPMSCPPNAFQTGESVIRLEPGQSVSTTWGVRLR